MIEFYSKKWQELNTTIEDYDRTSAELKTLGFGDDFMYGRLSAFEIVRRISTTETVAAIIRATVRVPENINLVELIRSKSFDDSQKAAALCSPLFLTRFLHLSGISPDMLKKLEIKMEAVKKKKPPKKKPTKKHLADSGLVS